MASNWKKLPLMTFNNNCLVVASLAVNSYIVIWIVFRLSIPIFSKSLKTFFQLYLRVDFFSHFICLSAVIETNPDIYAIADQLDQERAEGYVNIYSKHNYFLTVILT
jgi:hypothetical protein